MSARADGTGDPESRARTGDRESAECRRAAALAPWVAAGSAPAGEKAWLYRHVSACPACRADLARAMALALQVRRAAGSLPGPPPQVWQKLAAALPPEPAVPEGRQNGNAVLLGKVLVVLEQAGLPRLALGPVRWALRRA